MSHGSHDRLDPLAPRSPFYHGPFGRILPDLRPWDPGIDDNDLADHLLEIANTRMLEAPGSTPDELNEGDLDTQFRSTLPVGYTYFGQFVDHDITSTRRRAWSASTTPTAC